jgi:cyclophilin family peptidyl-prolyl cis-trans isomerase
VPSEADVKRTAIAVLLALAAVESAFAQTKNLPDGLYAEITTNRGVNLVSLAFEKAPMTVSNFVGLAEGTIKANGQTGKKYFDGLTFHRVVPGFVIQGGDPKGDGNGGPGYQFPNEVRPDLKHDSAGVMAMANAGPNTNGSQFYITLAPTPNLDGGYSVFGKVSQGMDVVQKIQQGDVMKTVRILRVGAAATAFVVTQKSFDDLVAKATAAVADAGRKAREAALADIRKKWPNLITTKTGLMYEILTNGSGASPQKTSTVSVKYTGMLLDGTVFDTTDNRGAASFRADQVIPGWTEALLAMKKGEKRRLVIPPELGYGERGYPGVIPGNAFLVFEVELLSF